MGTAKDIFIITTNTSIIYYYITFHLILIQIYKYLNKMEDLNLQIPKNFLYYPFYMIFYL